MSEFYDLMLVIRKDFNTRCKAFKLTLPSTLAGDPIYDLPQGAMTQMHFAINSNTSKIDRFIFSINFNELLIYPIGHDNCQLGITKRFDMGNPKFDETKVVNYLFRKLKYKTNGDYIERSWFNDAMI